MRAILALLLALLPVAAQAAPEKAKVSVCDPKVLFVLREGGFFWDRLPEYSIEIIRVVDDGSDDPTQTQTVAGMVADEEFPTFLKAVLPEPLRGGASYGVTVREKRTGEVVAAGFFNTRAGAKIQPSRVHAEAHFRFEVLSDTPLVPATDNSLKLVETLRKPLKNDQDGTIPGRTKEHEVDVHRQALDKPGCELPQISGVIVDLRPDDRLSSSSAGLRLEGLRDVFGQEVKAEGSLVPARSPKGKDDAFAYSRIFFESAEGRGTLDALSLDLKVQPLFQMAGPWLFRPELTASVSKNAPRASNSIRVAGLFSRTAVRGREDSKDDKDGKDRRLIYQTVFLGPSLEADRNFDRVNAIADLRWQPGLKGFYKSREVQRIAIAAKNNWRIDEVALPRTGYGLEFRIGAEAGASTSRQTVTNSAGNQSLELDRYEVLRARPHITAFYEVGLPLDWQLTLNVSSSLRYLFTEELTAVENPDRSLSPRKIDGFEPYTEATLSLSFDPGQHVALAVTYKDGAEPPVFVKVDKYSVGVVLKY